ncbi:MAG TPA: Wzz/FepE/Etk N-terminal domain-containing protein [Candidatus Izemoplasmatales bacterium]|nr:Wzz/FepE/Etk N-terminal domain-containing protein [Candidatus Izemoplasmatales bacterium]
MNEQIDKVSMEQDEGISLKELFKIVWDNIALIIIIGFWVVVLGVVYSFVIVTPQYTAQASVMIQVDVDEDVSSEQSALYIANSLKGTSEEFMLSNKVLLGVIEDLDLGMTTGALKNSISISSNQDALIMYISVENESPELAAQIVNQLIQNAKETADGVYDPSFESTYLKERLMPFDYARAPSNPSSPNKVLNIAISIILGGIIALGVVFVKEAFNNKFKSPEELEKYLKIKVLATVPGTVKERKVVE